MAQAVARQRIRASFERTELDEGEAMQFMPQRSQCSIRYFRIRASYRNRRKTHEALTSRPTEQRSYSGQDIAARRF